MTVAENIDIKIIHTDANCKECLENSIINSSFLKPTNQEEVNSTIKRTKINKALGPNIIRTKMPKMSQQIITKLLAYLLNISFSTGSSPVLLKTPNFIPAFKKGDNQDYNNYRPSSVISNPSKLIEN